MERRQNIVAFAAGALNGLIFAALCFAYSGWAILALPVLFAIWVLQYTLGLVDAGLHRKPSPTP